MQIPPYIETRIRRTPPILRHIVPGSTPVISFGDASKARYATFGLNPSRREFCDKNKWLLDGEERRLESLKSLGIRRLKDAPAETIARVVRGCYDYFNLKPYYG